MPKSKRYAVRDLSIAEIEEVAASFKEELQNEANRYVRRHNNQEALAALEAQDYIDKFLTTLRMIAGSQLREYLSRPARARQIHLSPRIIRK